MNDQIILEKLKINLGISTTAYDSRLKDYLNLAAAEIKREGITLDLTVASDCDILIMYAEWLWRRRSGDSGSFSMVTSVTGMPRMLRYLLNNRLFAEKLKED